MKPFDIFIFVTILQAQAKKEALRKVPEQTILAEVRQMVEEMQSLNKKLEETVSPATSIMINFIIPVSHQCRLASGFISFGCNCL